MFRMTLFALMFVVACADLAMGADVVELPVEAVLDVKGDGRDGRGNSNDDTWQFWFELVAPRGKSLHLDVPTAKMSPREREKGRPGKIDGPIGKDLPNPGATDGWIYHSDWNGCFEGAWGDNKTGKTMLYPYVEKGAHRGVSLSYTVPKAGAYKITGKVTDGFVWKHKRHKGFLCKVAAGRINGKFMQVTRELTSIGPIGDKVGPDSGTFTVKSVELKKGELIVVTVDPNGWWGSDLMVIDSLRIEYLGKVNPRTPAPTSR